MNITQIRSERLQRVMREAGLDGLLLYGNAWQNDYLRYVVDFGILEGEGIALATRDGDVTLYLNHALETERASVECPGVKIVYSADLVADIAAVIERLGNSRVAAGPKRHFPYGLARYSRHFDDATEQVDQLLMVKAAEELEWVRKAARMADEGYEVFRQAARAGQPDYALIAEVEAFFRAKGVDDNFMIIGSGGPEVRGMTPPSGKLLKQGDMVTTELTPCVGGYYAQICRTLVVGEPSAAQQQAFGLFREALEAGIAAVRPGVTAADVARAENDVFRHYGFGDYVTSEYTRVRGHGVGLFPDTKPHILEDVETVLQENMSIIVHPNTYHPEVGYIVLGDSLIIRSDGAENLSRTPRELFSGSVGKDAA